MKSHDNFLNKNEKQKKEGGGGEGGVRGSPHNE
jgi:hypothetical protein